MGGIISFLADPDLTITLDKLVRLQESIRSCRKAVAKNLADSAEPLKVIDPGIFKVPPPVFRFARGNNFSYEPERDGTDFTDVERHMILSGVYLRTLTLRLPTSASIHTYTCAYLGIVTREVRVRSRTRHRKDDQYKFRKPRTRRCRFLHSERGQGATVHAQRRQVLCWLVWEG